MHRHQRRAENYREGRASLLLAFVIAIAICGSAIVFFVMDAPETIPLSERAAGNSSSPEDSAAEPLGEERAASETEGAAAGGEARSTDASETTAALDARDPAVYVAFGSVTRSSGEAIASATLRWLPLTSYRALWLSHDYRTLAAGATLEGAPLSSEIRKALAESVETKTAEDGSYELKIPREHGVVLAFKIGFESRIEGLSEADKSPSPVILEAPAEIEGKDPEPRKGDEDGSAAAGGAGSTGSTGSTSEGDRRRRIDFHLEPASSISGVVREVGSGDPAAGMIVVATKIVVDRPAIFGIHDSDSARATVLSDGAYSIHGLAPGDYLVYPRTGESYFIGVSSRRARKIVVEEASDISDVDFEVHRGGTIRGLILDPMGEVLSGVKCQVIPENYMSLMMSGKADAAGAFREAEKKSDVRGRFEVHGLPLGKKYYVAATPDDYALATVDPVELTESEPEASVEIRLDPGFAIRGVVLDHQGQPVMEAVVSLLPDLGKALGGNIGALASARNSATSGEGGEFALQHLNSGEHKLVAAMDGRGTQQLFMDQGGTTITVGRADVEGVVLTLPKEEDSSHLISGRVIDDLGQAVEGAKVVVSKVGDFAQLKRKTATTEDDGTFTVADLGEGSFRLSAEKSGFSGPKAHNVPSDTVDAVIVMQSNATITGRILTDAGPWAGKGGKVMARPVEQATLIESVTRMARGGRSRKQYQAEVLEDGRFTVNAMAGKVLIRAIIPGYAPGVSREMDVEPGQQYGDVDIMVSAGATVFGLVVNPEHLPVSGATVRVRGELAKNDMMARLMPDFFGSARNQDISDDEGGYLISHLAPGDYEITVSHDEFAPADPVKMTLTRDQEWKAPRIVLHRGAVVDCILIEADKPIVGYMVQLMGAGPLQQGMSGPDGRVHFQGLKAGDYILNVMDITAMQTGKWKMKSRQVSLAESQNVEIQIVFGTGFRIHGNVSGLPPAPMRMMTLRRPGGPSPEETDYGEATSSMEWNKYQASITMIAKDDKYEFPDVDPGKYILEITKMPDDPTDMEAYKNMDRTPPFRKEIEIKDRDIDLDIKIEN